MAPIPINKSSSWKHFGDDSTSSYDQNTLRSLLQFQRNDKSPERAVRPRLRLRPDQRRNPQPGTASKPVSIKCDVVLGCSLREPRSYEERQEESRSELSHRSGDPAEDWSEQSRRHEERDVKRVYNDIITMADQDEDGIVSRICQYSTGSRYGYLIDHCPEPPKPVLPQRPHFIHRGQLMRYPSPDNGGISRGVRVDLTLGTITLALIFLLLVAIMIVEAVDVICSARDSSGEEEKRGRSRLRRALTGKIRTRRMTASSITSDETTLKGNRFGEHED